MKWLALSALGVAVVFIAIFGGCTASTYNGLVSSRNAVDQKWADVETQYQRRLDTIPKFAEVAQFSAEFQMKLATEYARLRENLAQAQASGDPDALDAVNQGVTALLIAVRQEAVPTANTDQLTELNSEISNIERVISHERSAFNAALTNFRNKKQTFPGNFVNSILGVSDPVHNELFKAVPGAEESPDIDLNLD